MRSLRIVYVDKRLADHDPGLRLVSGRDAFPAPARKSAIFSLGIFSTAASGDGALACRLSLAERSLMTGGFRAQAEFRSVLTWRDPTKSGS